PGAGAEQPWQGRAAQVDDEIPRRCRDRAIEAQPVPGEAPLLDDDDPLERRISGEERRRRRTRGDGHARRGVTLAEMPEQSGRKHGVADAGRGDEEDLHVARMKPPSLFKSPAGPGESMAANRGGAPRRRRGLYNRPAALPSQAQPWCRYHLKPSRIAVKHILSIGTQSPLLACGERKGEGARVHDMRAGPRERPLPLTRSADTLRPLPASGERHVSRCPARRWL